MSEATKVLEIVKSGLQGSWLSKFFTNPKQVILRSQNPEVVLFQDHMQVDMKEQKLSTEAVKAQLMEVTLAKEQVELEKKQDQTNDEIDVILEMMKKQQQP